MHNLTINKNIIYSFYLKLRKIRLKFYNLNFIGLKNEIKMKGKKIKVIKNKFKIKFIYNI